MGRYTSGDIEHKFWFAVQNSNAADRFGVTGVQPEELYYYFDNGNLDDVEEEDEDEDVENIPELKHDLHTSISDFTKVYDEFHEKVESKGNYKVIDTDKQVLGVIG